MESQYRIWTFLDVSTIAGYFKDNRLKIAKEVNRRNYQDLLWDAIEERFRMALDQALFIGDGWRIERTSAVWAASKYKLYNNGF